MKTLLFLISSFAKFSRFALFCLFFGWGGTVWAQQLPRLTTTVQDRGNPGSAIEVNGVNLNRNNLGQIWNGGAPYRIQMVSQTGQRVNCTFTFVSSSRLRVFIPQTGFSSHFFLVQGAYESASDRCVRVTRALPAGRGVVTIDNLSQYTILSLTINGQEMLPAGVGFFPKAVGEFIVPFGQKQIVASLGNTDRNNPFFSSRVTLNVGAETRRRLMTVNRVTCPQLLTNFQADSVWSSDVFLVGDEFRFRSYRFTSNGQFQLREHRPGNVITQLSSGSIVETSWQNHALAVGLRFGQINTTTFFPFGSFLANSGPNGQTLQFTRN